MSINRITVSDVEPIIVDGEPRRSPCCRSGYPRIRKLIWMAVLAAAFAMAVSVPIVLRSLKNTESANSSMEEVTTEEISMEWTERSVVTNTAASREVRTTEIPTPTASRDEHPSTAQSDRPLKWKQHASTVAGGNGVGGELNQLNEPWNIRVYDDEQVILVADRGNHRILEWKFGAREGKVIAGGNRPGSQIDQLHLPTDAVLNKRRTLVIVCDRQNARIMSWSRQQNESPRQLGDRIVCHGLALDSNGDLYVADFSGGVVKRLRDQEWTATLVAGVRPSGSALNRLDTPTYIFVDEQNSVYVADSKNDRVMKWMKGATEGIQVAPVQPARNNSEYLSYMKGMTVDHLGYVYTTCLQRHYVMRWSLNSSDHEIVAGREQYGNTADHLLHPEGLSFDKQHNLYVLDMRNSRVQKFDVDRS